MEGGPGGLGPPGLDLEPTLVSVHLVPTLRKLLGTVATTQPSQVQG